MVFDRIHYECAKAYQIREPQLLDVFRMGPAVLFLERARNGVENDKLLQLEIIQKSKTISGMRKIVSPQLKINV